MLPQFCSLTIAKICYFNIDVILVAGGKIKPSLNRLYKFDSEGADHISTRTTKSKGTAHGSKTKSTQTEDHTNGIYKKYTQIDKFTLNIV